MFKVVTPLARDLAKDVALRLEEQRVHVERMEQYVNRGLVGGDTSYGILPKSNNDDNDGDDNKEQMDPTTTNTITTTGGQTIIKTNSSKWWNQPPPIVTKTTPRDDPKREAILKKASTNLRNLKMLHESTYDVAQGLYQHLVAKEGSDSEDNAFLDINETKWIKAALRQVRDRHALTVENLAEFVITTRPLWDTPSAMDPTVMDFLRGRLGVQLLCEHYLAPSSEQGHGIVCVECPLDEVLEDAIMEASILCESNYSHLVTAAPEVIIVNQTIGRKDQFTIVRPWVHYVLVELLKNAMAISMERMGDSNTEAGGGDSPLAIYISIDDHHEEGDDLKSYLSIDVLDQGGGFAKPELAENTDILFDFVRTKTTMWDRLDDQQTYAMPSSPMQGLGVGLCLSRLAMQHFGGTVEVRQHPPLSLCQKQAFEGYDLEKGCIASIKLVKDLDHAEHLYGYEDKDFDTACDGSSSSSS